VIPNREETIRELTLHGLDRFRSSGSSAGDMAVRSLEQTLSAWGGHPRDIDALIYCSNAFTLDDATMLSRFIAANDLDKASVMTLGFGGCANLLPAMQLARALIRGGEAEHVAIVTADRASGDVDRVALMDLGILSDGAASCVMSAYPSETAGFELLGLGLRSSNRLRGDMPRARAFTARVQGVRGAATDALDEAGLTAATIGGVLMANIRRDLQLFFAKQCGICSESLFLDSLGPVSHCFSADPLINLSLFFARFEAATTASPVLALCLSPYKWGAFAARPTASAPILDTEGSCP
jgi:3-oxoacyl-[acyl-carrier-protein] synthase-3